MRVTKLVAGKLVQPRMQGLRLAGSIAFATLAAVILCGGGSPALAGDGYPFGVQLAGEPQVGCIVTTGEDPCTDARIRGTVVADGETSFAGVFDFRLPAPKGDGRRTARSSGRGLLEGDLILEPGETSRHCTLRGRVRAQGVFLPAGSSVQRFHTGTFEARGRCDGVVVRLRAIWSGTVGPAGGPMILDFSRFEGRLAGMLRFM